MKICSIHSSNRKGNTDKTIEIIKDTLNDLDPNMEYNDIYLPKDLPEFCLGCFNCLNTGENGGENCPHRKYVKPLEDKIFEADGIIIACPVYALSITAQLKTLFDHFACHFINHRPNESMFNKTGFIVSTAAGAGFKHTVGVIEKNLYYLGIKRTLTYKLRMFSASWDNMSDKKRIKAEKELQKKTKKFYNMTKNRMNIYRNPRSTILKMVFKQMIKNYDDDTPDKIFWKKKGWI
ncbi:MAG: NAD(P)H-dependent oxidoreductase [Methanobacteriaceae archaeon]|nr:NAD(P)H-dependent oxidoreductase [Methanobacteriaceae archaeon]